MDNIQPIVNGSVNPNLTKEIFKELPFTTQKQVIWNIMVSTEFAHSFKNTDPEVFSKPAERYDFDSIQEDNALELFETMQQRFKNQHDRLLSRTRDRRFKLGQEIYAKQRELGFGGMLQMDIDRLLGYIEACGNWNDFNSKAISRAMMQLDTVLPRRDCGLNNPNTGTDFHKWKTVHGCEYIILEFEFIDAKDLERVQEFYTKHFKPKGSVIKADSIRIETQPLDNNGQYFSAELVWWWD